MDRRSWTLLMGLGAVWGASYLFIAISLRDLSPAGVAFVRTALAAAVILPIALRSGALAGLRSRLGTVTVLAAVQVAGPFLLISAGQTRIDSGLAGILVATTPIVAALLAFRVDPSERATGMRAAGILVGIAGVALLLGVDLDGGPAELAGGLAVVLAAVGYAIGGFVVKLRLAGLRPLGTVALVMAASALMLLPVAAATHPGGLPGPGPAAAVTALGLVGTGVAFVVFYTLYARIGASRTILVTYIAPGFAVLYGVTLLGEAFTAATAAGLGLVLAGSWLAAGSNGPAAGQTAPEPVPPQADPISDHALAQGARRSR